MDQLGESTQQRLLKSAKTLFAQRGYEQTSTAAIARDAGTSESQLVRHFGGKRGLLSAVFDQAWYVLNEQIAQRVRKTTDPIAAIETMFATITEAFHRDQDLAYLFLFEGRRIREGGRHLELSEGYREFARSLHQLIRAAQRTERIAKGISTAALAAALMGAAEGMMRDAMIAKLSDQTPPYARSQMRSVFAAFLRAAAASAITPKQRKAPG
jgi:AcrR family transcriptional regulator